MLCRNFPRMLLPLLSLTVLAAACPDGEHHADTHTKPRHLKLQPAEPYRDLVWGDFNVIHTTDMHGWLLGHQGQSWPEPSYSGNLGEFASFVTHMKQIAEEKLDVDLLLVDSGDLRDGNGLSDGGPQGEVDGHRSSLFIKELPYDLMTVGKHTSFSRGKLDGRYLSSNAYITVSDSNGSAVSEPIGRHRYARFKTRKGRQVTSLGVLFNFTGADKNIAVHFVGNMIEEDWFKEVIEQEADVFVLVGHMPVSNNNWTDVFGAIRRVERHQYTPILIFGGHTHIRDCQQYDQRSIALESGKYMDTIGWASANLSVGVGNTDPISFTRRYLDQNRVTYEYHLKPFGIAKFDTELGRNITKGLQELANDYNLGRFYGTAPQDYTTNRDKYPSESNLLRLFINEAAPVALADSGRANHSKIFIANADLLRYDVFEGPFTRNEELFSSMYLDSFLYFADVKLSVAKDALRKLDEIPRLPREGWPRVPTSRLVQRRSQAWLDEMNKHQTTLAADTTNLTIGYVTTDNCSRAGGAGDDTLHVLPPNFKLPHYVYSDPPDVPDETPVDLVFIDHLKRHVVDALNGVQTDIDYSKVVADKYSQTLTNAVLGLYAEAKWPNTTQDN